MSIDAVMGRIREIEGRIGEIRDRTSGKAAAPAFSAALAKAGIPVTATPATTAPGISAGSTPTSTLPSPTTPAGIAGMVTSAAKRNQLDPALLQAVVNTESGGNPAATSPVGAMGLMQLMPGTAKDLGVANPYDAQQNLDGGARYLADLTHRFGLKNGVAAYNAGPGAVESHGGVPPYPETQHYVDKVLTTYTELKR